MAKEAGAVLRVVNNWLHGTSQAVSRSAILDEFETSLIVNCEI